MSKTKFKDYFELLEVTKDSTKDEIKKSFMAKALVYHPDKAKTDVQRNIHTRLYTDLQEAYRILTNDEARKQYMDANQPTQMDLLNRNERDVTYQRPPPSSTERFDTRAFNKQFDEARKDSDFEKLNQQFTKQTPIKRMEVDNYIRQRDLELRMGASSANLPYELRTLATGSDIEEIGGYNSGLEETNGIASSFSFANYGIENIISEPERFQGLDLSSHDSKISDSKISKTEAADRIRQIQAERDSLSKIKGPEFRVEKTEIESAFPDLFISNVEGIEGRKGSPLRKI